MARILVVEDDRTLALGLREDLELEGYEVEVVADGAAASRCALESRFDLVVLDVMLPGKDGFEVCRDLRRHGVATPIILLTARTQETDKVLGLELGADDYITKPFSPRELRARVKAAIRRGAGNRPTVFRTGDLEVDFVRGELRRSGRPVDLSALEFKLLSAFIHHKGRVLTRAELLDEVWGSATHVTDRVVDTHVMKLRRKVEPDPESPRHLVGLRGVGYRFDE